MYQITHHYLTVDDDDTVVVETETRMVDDVFDLAAAVENMVVAPGGRSGTTISLTVSRVDTIVS